MRIQRAPENRGAPAGPSRLPPPRYGAGATFPAVKRPQLIWKVTEVAPPTNWYPLFRTSVTTPV